LTQPYSSVRIRNMDGTAGVASEPGSIGPWAQDAAGTSAAVHGGTASLPTSPTMMDRLMREGGYASESGTGAVHRLATGTTSGASPSPVPSGGRKSVLLVEPSSSSLSGRSLTTTTSDLIAGKRSARWLSVPSGLRSSAVPSPEPSSLQQQPGQVAAEGSHVDSAGQESPSASPAPGVGEQHSQAGGVTVATTATAAAAADTADGALSAAAADDAEDRGMTPNTRLRTIVEATVTADEAHTRALPLQPVNASRRTSVAVHDPTHQQDSSTTAGLTGEASKASLGKEPSVASWKEGGSQASQAAGAAAGGEGERTSESGTLQKEPSTAKAGYRYYSKTVWYHVETGTEAVQLQGGSQGGTTGGVTQHTTSMAQSPQRQRSPSPGGMCGG
jgi:hypothetical protein